MNAFRRLSRRQVYRNRFLTLEVHSVVHPSGASGEHALIVAPRCSAVIVSDGDDFLFVRQPRFGAGAEVLEIVKGGAEGDETPLECAQREAREELGIVAHDWESLGQLFEIPSLMNSAVELFHAGAVEHVDASPEPVESIELVRVAQHTALAAAATGRINDAVTVAALLRYGMLKKVLQVRADA